MIWLSLLAFAAVLPTAASIAVEEMSLAPPVASYSIDARLEPEARRIRGRSILRWQNTGEQPVSELCFHLYMNAFANNYTSLMRALPRETRRWAARFPDEWGAIDITRLQVGEIDLTGGIDFIQPDDGNPHDRTVALVPLAEAVQPSETVEVGMNFEVRLPRIFRRTGHAAPFFFVAQWFPKVAVLQGDAWNCHQYQANSEFFADFGTYDVRLTVPKDFVVGHTGVVRAERDNGDGSRTVEIRAESVHDFAWTADPRFLVVEEELDGVRVVFLLSPHHAGQAGRYLDALRAAMAHYTKWFGPYPYPQVTLVDPSPAAMGAAGMEYPMLFTAGTAWWMPRDVRVPEFLTVHEFGHQYWQGVVATDEVHEPWLDEGINSFVEGRVMDDTYGSRASYFDLFGLRMNATAFARLRYLANGSSDPIARAAPRMLDRRSYQATAYAKTALMLETLDRYLGGDRLQRALGDYYREWRFKHPTGADWRASISQSVGEDLDWYFRQVLDGTGTLDYAVATLDVNRERPLQGRDITAVGELSATEMRRFRNQIVFARLGEVRMPVDLLVVFEDGSEKRASWDGQDRWYRIDITGTEKVKYAVVDPEQKLPLDIDRLNNSRMRNSGTRGIVRLVVRWGLWLQGVLHLITGL